MIQTFFESEHEGPCLLHMCNANLECVSLVGVKYRDVFGQPGPKKPFTQMGLIKFVRMTPNLCWFRSDLNAENIAMLRGEYPHIHFCS